jgi:hypothetical protein
MAFELLKTFQRFHKPDRLLRLSLQFVNSPQLSQKHFPMIGIISHQKTHRAHTFNSVNYMFSKAVYSTELICLL